MSASRIPSKTRLLIINHNIKANIQAKHVYSRKGSNSDKGSSSQYKAPRSTRAGSKAPPFVYASECGPAAFNSTDLERVSGASEYPKRQERIESWRQAVVPHGREQQTLVPFEQPRNSASTIQYPQPDNRLVLYNKPSADREAASCSALVLHEPRKNQQYSSALQSVDHATRVAPSHRAKSRSEYSQSSSGRSLSSRSSCATSIDGNRSGRQKRRRPTQSSNGSNIRHPPPPPPLPPPLPPYFQRPQGPGQPPPGPVSSPRYPQEQPPGPQTEPQFEHGVQPSPTEYLREPPQCSYCPSCPSSCSDRLIDSPQTEISSFEEEKLWVTKKLAEATEEVAWEMRRHNDDVDAMLYQRPMCYPEFSIFPNYRY
ncbi:hypothetical protein EAE96_010282 [Botrytis aclada]|nr:hypothetical protein EAE96_010282 [Botrytis aclada]